MVNAYFIFSYNMSRGTILNAFKILMRIRIIITPNINTFEIIYSVIMCPYKMREREMVERH